MYFSLSVAAFITGLNIRLLVGAVARTSQCIWSRGQLMCDQTRAETDFVFRRNGRVHLHRRGRQFSRLLAAEVCASAFIVGSNAGYTMFRGNVKGTGYPLHSPVSPSLPLPCVTVCHHISTGVYLSTFDCHSDVPFQENIHVQPDAVVTLR